MSMYTHELKCSGKTISVETGKWAKQADGAIVYRCGKLTLLATVCAEKEAREGQSFFPLSVDYREKFYSSGRIPGGYFKRENRPGEHETLISRLIDRPCRPLFPQGYFSEVQLLITLLSYDPKEPVEGHAITAASAAILLSDIPWEGPIAGVLVGRVDGKFISDPNPEEREKSDIELLISGSKDGVTMIEGESKESTNEEMLEAIAFGHKALQPKIELQEKVASQMNIVKRKLSLRLPDPSLKEELHSFAFEKMKEANLTSDKSEREEKIKKVCEESIQHFEEKLKDQGKWDAIESELKSELHNIEYLIVRAQIFEKGIRADGRKLDEIRDISVEMDVIPGAHGSSVFTRGQTQSLATVTLGSKMDNQRYETLEGEKHRSFLLHYNFPPFSTGEVKRMLATGRREIGHGNLALRSLKNVLPPEKDFPYVIRIVSEILESNGSSSMASVCSGSLAMMAAGVPVKAAVSGIAMGLILDDTGKPAILSDIAGLEDHFGDMDFKLAGTSKGITAFQLDLKVKGVSLDILKEALQAAEKGRLHILEKMNETFSKPRADIPDTAPRIDHLQVDTGRIGELIGPGGRIIREIMERTGAEINVEDSGVVTIASSSSKSNQEAKKIIENIFREPVSGESYEGVIKRIVDFGAFVEISPGKEGLLHISKMSDSRLESVTDLYKEGDKVPVVINNIDHSGKMDLLHRDLQHLARPSDGFSGRRGGNTGGRDGGGRDGGGGGRDSRNGGGFRSSRSNGGGAGRPQYRPRDRDGGRGGDRDNRGGGGRDFHSKKDSGGRRHSSSARRRP